MRACVCVQKKLIVVARAMRLKVSSEGIWFLSEIRLSLKYFRSLAKIWSETIINVLRAYQLKVNINCIIIVIFLNDRYNCKENRKLRLARNYYHFPYANVLTSKTDYYFHQTYRQLEQYSRMRVYISFFNFTVCDTCIFPIKYTIRNLPPRYE